MAAVEEDAVQFALSPDKVADSDTRNRMCILNQIFVVLQVLQVYHKQLASNARSQATSKTIWPTVRFNLELEKSLVH